MRKKSISKIYIGVCIVLLLALAMPVLGGCGQQAELNIGLTQFASHPAADAGRFGFMEALSDNGFVQTGEACPEGMERVDVAYDYQNPEGDPTTEQTIAQKFATDKVDMIFSFGTRITQQCVNAVEGTDIPVLFCAITDPVAAELVSDWHHPGEFVTGTSDMIEVDSNVELIMDIVPGLETMGTLYNSGEVNSVVLNDQLKEVCSDMGIELIEVTVSTSAEVQTAAQSLVGKVDAIWVGTDNTVVSGLEALIKVCEDNQIPFFPSDDPSIEKGGIATLGFDYYDVGYQTGLMAVKILNGTPADEVDVELGNIFTYTVNTKAAEIYGVSIPQSILDKAGTVYTEVR
ncbi:ABC transporter substrate-binding protein [Chloroflexota bacterium]